MYRNLPELFQQCQSRGRVLINRAYGNCDNKSKELHELISSTDVEFFHRPPVDKSNADVQLAVDAIELAMTRPSINRFVITAGDTDIKPLMSKLRGFGCYTTVIAKSQDVNERLRDCADEIFLLDPLLVRGALLVHAWMLGCCVVAIYTLPTIACFLVHFSHQFPSSPRAYNTLIR